MAESSQTAARLTFEQILEQLYREHKRLEVEYRKLAEYKKLAEEYRNAEEIRRHEAEERKLAEFTQLRDDFGQLEAGYRILENEYRKLAEDKKYQDELRAAEDQRRLDEDLRRQEEYARREEEDLRKQEEYARREEEAKVAEERTLKAEFLRQNDRRQIDTPCPHHFYIGLLLDSCSNMIFVLDREMKIVMATGNMARLFGVQNLEPILNQDFRSLFSTMLTAEDIEGLSGQYAGVMESTDQAHFTRNLSLQDGRTMTVDCTVTPAIDAKGEHHGVVVDLHDITELDAAKRHAENASRSKSSFLATVSHEIRTPLNAVLGLSEIEMQKDLPNETRDNLEKIYGSGSSLLGIINDILDISKIEAGSMEIVPTKYNMSGLMSSAIQLNLVRIGAKDINFDLDMDPKMPEHLYGDELRVKQILNNLLSNAFKYTEHGTVKLAVEWVQEDASARVTFIVTDTGQGIREGDIGKLFSEYKQLNSRSNRYIEGTGLGLSITKRLAELMDGTISVESKFGHGSTFTVSLMQQIVDLTPVGEDAIKNLREFRFAEYRNKMKKNLIRSYMPYGKVLVVDDVLTNLEVARGLLLPYGLTIDCVASGPESIERIRAGGSDGVPFYDLVLMDHMMPEMDGVEATKIIRSDILTDYAKNLPIIALTANAMAGVEEMFLRNGFDGFISKPIDIMRLDVELNKWIRSKQDNSIQINVPAKPQPQPAAQMEEEAPPASGPKLDAKAPAMGLSGPSGKPLGAGKLSGDIRVEGLDIQEGLSRYGGDEVYFGVLKTYVDSTPQLLNKMRIISGGKLPEYAVTVHGIKGSSYGVCAATAGKWAERLEMAAKRGDLEAVLSENNDFIKMMERLLSAIGNMLQGPSGKDKTEKPQAFAPDRKVLERILLACKQYDLNVMDQYLMELEGIDYEYGGDLVTWLRSQMDNLEYGAIEEQLSKTLTSARKR